jgi:hypothetical protein
MRAIEDFKDFLSLSEQSRGQWDSRQKRGEVALTFGLERRLAAGIMMDTDVVLHLVVEEFTPAFTAAYAARVWCAHPDKFLQGVGLADAQAEPVFLMVAEYGDKVHRDSKRAGSWFRDKQMVGPVTIDGIYPFSDNPEVPVPDRITMVCVNSILKRVRERAAKIGLDWSAPFFPPPSDPTAAKLIALGKAQREYALRVYRGEEIQVTPGTTVQ